MGCCGSHESTDPLPPKKSKKSNGKNSSLTAKIVMMGTSNVGKSQILNRFMHETYDANPG